MKQVLPSTITLCFLQLCAVGALRSGDLKVQLSSETADAGNLSQRFSPLECKRELSDLYCCGSAVDGTCKDGRRQVCAPEVGMKCSFKFGKGTKCKCVTNHCYDTLTGTCRPVEAMPITIGPPGLEEETTVPLSSIDEVFAEATVVSEAEADEQRSSFSKGGLIDRMVGKLAQKFVFGSDGKFEKWLQWSIANFLLYHDEPGKKCDRGNAILNVKPDKGKCYWNFIDSTAPNDPVWWGQILPYSGAGLSFNISLSVKLSQLRCLEALRVEKSTCHGNILAAGGYCDVELTPDPECPLRVKDLELEFYCEGHCEVNQHVMSLLHSSKEFEVGDIVYIEKYRRDEEDVPAKMHDQKLDGCSSRKMKVMKRFYKCSPTDGECSRFCVADVETDENFGCWTAKNLLHENDCSYVKQATRWVANLLVGGRKQDMYQVTEKRQLLYRKFDVIFDEHMSLSSRIFLHKTRSLNEVIDDEDDKAEKSKIEAAFSSTFNSINRGVQRVRLPFQSTKNTEELIKKYKLNTVEMYSATGVKLGEELMTCNIPIWNWDTRSYDQPPLEKCFKVRMRDLEMRSNSRNYLTIEESVPEYYTQQGMTSGYVLSVVGQVAKILFAREIVTIQSPGVKDGELYFCKDEWSSKDSVIGLTCDSRELKRTGKKKGSPVKSEFFFELIELPPIWNHDQKRNQMQVALRGGHKMDFCQLFGGHIVCNVELPKPNGFAEFDVNLIPPSAKFLIEHVGKNDLESKVVIQTGETATSAVTCSSGEDLHSCPQVDDEEGIEDEIETEWEDIFDGPESLQLRLKSLVSANYCTTTLGTQQRTMGFDRERMFLSCDSPGSEDPSANLLTLHGNVDPLTPNKRWEHLIVLSMTCIGAATGFTSAAWASFFGPGGMIYTFSSVALGTSVGYGGGLALQGFLKEAHIDGIFMRYLVKRRLQEAREKLLWSASLLMDFELPRL